MGLALKTTRRRWMIWTFVCLALASCSSPATGADVALDDGAALDATPDGAMTVDAGLIADATTDASPDDPCGNTCDADGDGVPDASELQVALAFEPYLWLSIREEGWRDDRLPHFAVEPNPTGGAGLSIFYAQSYFEDYGDPDLGGFSSHLGDSEFVVVEVSGAGPWQLERVFLSAHFRSLTDGSGWFDVTEVQVHADATGLEHPVVYVSEWKHANYRDLQSCDAGALFTDHCEEHTFERLGIAPGRNLGNPGTPLIDDVLHAGNHEFYWSDVRFCGWRVSSEDNGDRGGCTALSSTYGTFMGDWLTDQL